MTFNENDVNREQDGKFGAKTGGPPDPSVTLSPSDYLTLPFDALASRAYRAGERVGPSRHDITAGDKALVLELEVALRDNEPDTALIQATEKFAERMKESNFNDAGLRLNAALAEAGYRADYGSPVKNPEAVMQVSKNPDVVRAAEADYRDRIYAEHLAAGYDAGTSRSYARDRTDDWLVRNPDLDDEMVQALSARVTGWQRDALRIRYRNVPETG